MSFTVENLEEKNMVKLVIESTAEEFEAGLNTCLLYTSPPAHGYSPFSPPALP